MKKKTSKTTKPINEKKPLKKTGNKKKDTKKPPQKPKKEVKKEPEVIEEVPVESQEPIIEEAPPQIDRRPFLFFYQYSLILNLIFLKYQCRIGYFLAFLILPFVPLILLLVL